MNCLHLHFKEYRDDFQIEDKQARGCQMYAICPLTISALELREQSRHAVAACKIWQGAVADFEHHMQRQGFR